MVILIPYKKTTTTQQSAQLFFEHVWKHYCIPTTIITDRDSRFLLASSGRHSGSSSTHSYPCRPRSILRQMGRPRLSIAWWYSCFESTTISIDGHGTRFSHTYSISITELSTLKQARVRLNSVLDLNPQCLSTQSVDRLFQPTQTMNNDKSTKLSSSMIRFVRSRSKLKRCCRGPVKKLRLDTISIMFLIHSKLGIKSSCIYRWRGLCLLLPVLGQASLQ